MQYKIITTPSGSPVIVEALTIDGQPVLGDPICICPDDPEHHRLVRQANMYEVLRDKLFNELHGKGNAREIQRLLRECSDGDRRDEQAVRRQRMAEAQEAEAIAEALLERSFARSD